MWKDTTHIPGSKNLWKHLEGWLPLQQTEIWTTNSGKSSDFTLKVIKPIFSDALELAHPPTCFKTCDSGLHLSPKIHWQ